MNRGLNFIACAHPTGWMLTDLAGLRFDPAVAGGRRLLLAPRIPTTEKLDWVKASVKTLHGSLRSELRKQPDGTVEWRFEIPANVSAQVVPPVPAGRSDTLRSTQGPVSTAADGSLELAAGTHGLVWSMQ